MKTIPLVSVLSLCCLGVAGAAHAADRPFVRVVVPADSAQGVPTNTGLWLGYGVSADLTVFANDPVLRDEAGTLLTPVLTAEQMPDGGVIVRSEPLDLEPETTYEVLSRLRACSAAEPGQVCPQDAYAVLATFETGTSRDTVAPSVALDGKVTAATEPCTFTVRLQGADDRTPAEALLFSVDGSLQSDATLLVNGSSEPSAIRVAARDLSGNLSSELSIALPACDPEDVPRDVVSTDLGCDVGPECQRPNDGCSVGFVGRHQGTASSFVSCLCLALWTAVRGRRRSRGVTG